MSFFNYLDQFFERLKPKELTSNKLGLFYGVFLPGFLSVFGVITFLRLPKILGQAGPFYFSLILILGILINLLTAFSISSTVTNFNLKSGGVYTLISRCFGAELGIAVSLPLYFSQAINISFCVMGLLEIIEPFLIFNFKIVVGISILSILLFFSFLPQKALRLLQSLVFLGLIIAFSFVAYSVDMTSIPIASEFPKKPFWQLFAAFFPAITGFESGLFSIDQLKNHKRSFPVGTILTVLISFILYLVFAFFLIHSIDSTQLLKQDQILMQIVKPSWVLMQALIGSTILYALSCFLNAPKLLQAMAHDALLPKKIWDKIQGPKESLVATIATCILATLFFVLFDLDLLSPLLTHFFLLSYAMLNLACFIEAFMQNPSWRPSFYVHYSYPLFGFILSFAVMLMIDPGLSFLSWFFVIAIYFAMRLKQFSQNFDDVRQSMLLYISRFVTYRLVDFQTPSLRSWRPQVICFSQNLTQMTPTMKLAKALTQNKGFLIVASALKKDIEEEKIPRIKRMVREFFSRHDVDALIELKSGKEIDDLVAEMIKGYGLGPIKPNTILFSYDLYRGSLHRFDQWMNDVELGQKNGLILCYKDQITCEEFNQFLFFKQAKRKTIALILEDESKGAQYFLFVLAALLQKSVEFFKAEVFCAFITSHTDAVDSIQEYYEEYFADQRFDFQIQVVLKGEPIGKEFDLVIETYRNFHLQINCAKERADYGGMTLLVHQCERLAFDPHLD